MNIKRFLGLFCALCLLPGLVQAAEESVMPFIKAEYWKQNISLKDFKANPRLYYRTEAAFQLSRQYAERVVGQSLTDGEFVALLRSDQARAVTCEGELTTGALSANDFYWFERPCRAGEEILQIKIGERWVDLMSLGCLNAVEDKLPVVPPVMFANKKSVTKQIAVEHCPPVQLMTITTPGTTRQSLRPQVVGVNSCNCGFKAGVIVSRQVIQIPGASLPVAYKPPCSTQYVEIETIREE